MEPNDDTRPAPSGARKRGGADDRGGWRELIAGLRVSPDEIEQKNAVRDLYPEASSEAELAYRIWRRGLQVDLARLVSMGGELPPGVTERQLAMLVTQDLLACLPLLNRVGTLSEIVALLAPHASGRSEPGNPAPSSNDDTPIDPSAADSVLGVDDFL